MTNYLETKSFSLVFGNYYFSLYGRRLFYLPESHCFKLALKRELKDATEDVISGSLVLVPDGQEWQLGLIICTCSQWAITRLTNIF